jgi:hypothetical protein
VMSNKLGEGLELLAWNNISCQESMAWKGHWDPILYGK